MGKILQFGLFRDYDENKTYIGYQGDKKKPLSICEIPGIADERIFKKTISEVFGGNGIDFYFGAGPSITYEEFFEDDLSMSGIFGNGVFFDLDALVLKKRGKRYYYNRGERDVEIDRNVFETVVNARNFFEGNFAKVIDVVTEAPDPKELESEEDCEMFKDSLPEVPDVELLNSHLKQIEEGRRNRIPAEWILTLHFFIKALTSKYPEDTQPLKEARRQIWKLADGATFSASASHIVRLYIEKFPEVSDTIIDSHPEVPRSKDAIFYMGQTLFKVSRTEEQKAKVEQIREKWGSWSDEDPELEKKRVDLYRRMGLLGDE